MTYQELRKEALTRQLDNGNERARFEAMRDYVQNGGEVYTLDEIRKLTPDEIDADWPKVQYSLTYLVYKELL